MTLTRVIILADTTLHRAAWEALLRQQPGIEVWGTAANVDDVAVLLETGHAYAILLDLPHISPTLLRQLAELFVRSGILCLIDAYDLPQIITLLQAGTMGCLIRDASVVELTQALIAVSRGEIVLPPSLTAQALTALVRGDMRAEQLSESLTDREIDVLQLLAQGMTNKDIAQSLFLSVRTIEAHLHNIYGKLEISSRTEAVLWAIQHGYKP